MPATVRPSELRISQFRGVPEMELRFDPGTATYLIGPNNAGKTTVMNAIALAFKSAAFRTFTPTDFDYYRAPGGAHADTFSVSVIFEPVGAQLPAVQGVGSPVDVHGIQVVGKTDKRGGRFHRHVLLDHQHKPITHSQRTPLKGEEKEKYREQGLGYSRHYAKSDEIRDALPDIWHLTPENLERSLYHWKSGPLRRLAKLLSRRFFEEDWEVATESGPRPMPSSLNKVYEFFRSSVRTFPFWVDDLRPRLEDTLGRYIGRQARMELSPAIEALEEWLADQLVLAFAVDELGSVTPLDKMGQGWQSLVRIAAMDVLRQYPDEVRESVILLYEEPETYLHPHLSRKLRTILDGLGTEGWTVIASTHSPDFISFNSTQCVYRLNRFAGGLGVGVLHAGEVPEAAKFQELLDEQGNHELLFGNRAVLCEGKDDVLSLRHYLNEAGADLDGRSVSIVGVGGVSTLPGYAQMMCGLGIPWCGLTDEDLEDDGSVKPNTAKARDKLSSLAGSGDAQEVWPGSLEACLRLPAGKKATPEWQRENLLKLSREEITVTYPAFAATCDKILAWLVGTGAATE